MDYAIVRTGGKQYKVTEGLVVDVEKLEEGVGAIVELEVLAMERSGEVSIGTPLVTGARVVAEVQDHGRDEKKTSFKFHRKTRFRWKHGHRQPFTRLIIKEIAIATPEVKTNGS